MTTEQVLLLNGTANVKDEAIIQKVLRQIKPLSRYSVEERVPIEALEKLISVITRKYAIQPQWIMCTYGTNSAGQLGSYSCGVKTSDTHAWLGTVSGRSIYELLAKVAVFMYAEVRANRVSAHKSEVDRDGYS